jgi:hypothetical protein
MFKISSLNFIVNEILLFKYEISILIILILRFYNNVMKNFKIESNEYIISLIFKFNN